MSPATVARPHRGQRLAIPFVAVDVNGNDPFVVVNDWPSTAQGYLEGQGHAMALRCTEPVCIFVTCMAIHFHAAIFALVQFRQF